MTAFFSDNALVHRLILKSDRIVIFAISKVISGGNREEKLQTIHMLLSFCKIDRSPFCNIGL